MRFVVLGKIVNWSFRRSLLPREAKVPLKAGPETIGGEEVRSSAAFAAAYLGVALLSTVALTGAGASVEEAVFESVSALSNVGQSIGVTSRDLPSWTKVMLSFEMWMGRLEILPVLVLLYPRHWVGRGG
jgi:trk system potassium uptake protein